MSLARWVHLVAAVALLGGARGAGAETPTPTTRPDYDATFDAKDYGYCLVCHGSVGQGNEAIQAPALAGMSPWYLENQLEAFRRGWRGRHPEDLVGMGMYPIAEALDDTQVAEIKAYVGALGAVRSPVHADGDALAGEAVYRACAACHGATAQGEQALQAPALAYQSGTYLVRQLQHFRSGVRGATAGDTRGALMRAAAEGLSDDDIANVVAYVRSLSVPNGAGS